MFFVYVGQNAPHGLKLSRMFKLDGFLLNDVLDSASIFESYIASVLRLNDHRPLPPIENLGLLCQS